MRIWLAGAGANALDQTGREGIMARWGRIFAHADLEDCLAALDELGSEPVDPWPFPGDKERIAAIICDRAGAIRTRRRSAAAAARARTSADAALTRSPIGLVGVAAGIMARVKKAIQADTRHVEGCDEYRFAHEGRCLPECPVPRLVGRELAGEESGLPEDRSDRKSTRLNSSH